MTELHESAACRPHVKAGLDLWHKPDGSGQAGATSEAARIRDAKEICRTCPLKAACLAAATDDDHGIWGGLTLAERAAVRVCGDGVGTVKGYSRHRRARDTPCRACMDGWAAYKRARDERAKGAAA